MQLSDCRHRRPLSWRTKYYRTVAQNSGSPSTATFHSGFNFPTHSISRRPFSLVSFLPEFFLFFLKCWRLYTDNKEENVIWKSQKGRTERMSGWMAGQKGFHIKRGQARGVESVLLLNIYTHREWERERETYRCCCINCWQLDLPLSALEKSELSKTRFHKRVTVPRFMQKKKREGASFRPQLQQRRVMDPAVREEPTDNTKERHQTLLGLTFFPSVYSIFFLLRR